MRSPMQQPKRRSRPGFATTLERANVRGVWAFDEGRFGLRVGLRKTADDGQFPTIQHRMASEKPDRLFP